MSVLKVLKQTTNNISNVFWQQGRKSSFKGSPFLVDLGEITTKYEVTSVPAEWNHVARILPPTVIPEPPIKPSYPSGWKPQDQNVENKAYFVERTKNHMLPVYMRILQRGIRRLTYVKKIKGDIWLLEKEIREFLQRETIIPIRSQVNEFAGYICINGDHVNAIKYYLTERGL